ncbi:hypothetical protein [Pleurocapsa sp. PCC 7319]|uniref:hypothetical protein n=1 Tax=Pleurocapsa sp. PCC 7319 TaxID=118161 RepID=UPI001181A920|nr:hypothetical protein [Pleurocapsa sp. PCC 7319]
MNYPHVYTPFDFLTNRLPRIEKKAIALTNRRSPSDKLNQDNYLDPEKIRVFQIEVHNSWKSESKLNDVTYPITECLS